MNSDQQLIGQLTSSNCIGSFGCPTYYPTPIPYSAKKVIVEVVEGGYIISGYFHGKGDVRTVAVSPEGLAEILKGWCAQFQAG